MDNFIDVKSALKHFEACDSKLFAISQTIPELKIKPRRCDLTSFVRTVINQQLSNKAAETIYSRLKSKCCSQINSQNILNLKNDDYREIGISRLKQQYIEGLAELFVEYPEYIDHLKSLDDKCALKKLTSIRGLGLWSASILLLFYLRRPNIFAYGDNTINTAIMEIYDIDLIGAPSELDKLVSIWSPHNSTVNLILWSWVDSGKPSF